MRGKGRTGGAVLEAALAYIRDAGPSLRLVPWSEDDLARVVAAIQEAARVGSPVAARDDEPRQVMAVIAMRRWESFERRSKKKQSHRDARVEDLAKGLRDAYEDDRTLVGPLMVDYRWLAERIADAMTNVS